MSEQTRAKIAEGNRRRGARNRAALAEQLRDLPHLTHIEAAAVTGRDVKTVRSVRTEYGLASATRPVSAEARARLRAAGLRRNGGAT